MLALAVLLVFPILGWIIDVLLSIQEKRKGDGK
jgi:hypothetical protein